jgi:uncharacterized zinc-type alcohol dehydrogenase-like protein
MIETRSYAAQTAKSPLGPFSFTRRSPLEHDVVIDIAFCGVCHSDIHQARDEWGGSLFPMVPGHEIVGRVSQVGSSVSKFKVGDLAGVGCMVDSCRACAPCTQGHEQYCESGIVFTYNSKEKDGSIAQGGYSSKIVVNQDFVLRVGNGIALPEVAPLLCAGITTYSPLRRWSVAKGSRVGILGLGGLGHMGVKLAAAMGAEVTLFTSSESKVADGKRLGAHEVVVSSNAAAMKSMHGRLDLILDTVSAPHALEGFIDTLKTNTGTLCFLGVPPAPPTLHPFVLIGRRLSVAGSLIGGIAETQEMLDFCAKHHIGADIELISIQKINEAYARMIKSDVRYRFVIDSSTLG